MKTAQQDIDERTKLTGNNQFELLLFRLGESKGSGQRELFGIKVFKVREVLVLSHITELANSHEHLMGVANIRGQIIPVIDLPAVVGCSPARGRTILMVTEFGRTVQAFAVEEVNEIVRLDWSQVLPADASHASAMVTALARLDGANADTRLAQVLDVEQILKTVMPATTGEINREAVGPELQLPAGTQILVADDSAVARSVIALGLTDLEMPEMDGFTLTRTIKGDSRFSGIPVVIHSFLTGATNENHVKGVGADAYVAKFNPREFASTIRSVLPAAGILQG